MGYTDIINAIMEQNGDWDKCKTQQQIDSIFDFDEESDITEDLF